MQLHTHWHAATPSYCVPGCPAVGIRVILAKHWRFHLPVLTLRPCGRVYSLIRAGTIAGSVGMAGQGEEGRKRASVAADTRGRLAVGLGWHSAHGLTFLRPSVQTVRQGDMSAKLGTG